MRKGQNPVLEELKEKRFAKKTMHPGIVSISFQFLIVVLKADGKSEEENKSEGVSPPQASYF
jgi:hypothetical protein